MKESPPRLTDAQLARISELAVRYFLGWKPKEPGDRTRRNRSFEKQVQAIAESP